MGNHHRKTTSDPEKRRNWRPSEPTAWELARLVVWVIIQLLTS